MQSPDPAPRTIRLSVLDAELRVTTDSAALVRALETRLGAFVKEAAPSEEDGIEVRTQPAPPQLRVGSSVVALHGDDPAEQAFSAIFREIVDRIERYLLLHAASVAESGRAFLLAGSSGSGKTTLCLLLAQRGFQILSDDFTPLERRSGRVSPFPKAFGIRRGAGSSAAAGTAGARISGRRGLLSHDGLPPGARASGTAQLAGVVFIDPDGAEDLDPTSPFVLSVRCAGSCEPVQRRLERLDGLRLLDAQGKELLFRVDPKRASSHALEQELAQLGTSALEYGIVAGRSPRGDRAPRLLEISPARGAIMLLRELQNRRPRGRLLRSIDGDPTRLLPEIAGAISGVPMVRLEPGDPETTAALVERTLRSWSAAR